MVRGVDHLGPIENPKQPGEINQKQQTPIEAQLQEHSKDLIRTQHKALRKQIAKMLSDSQKGLDNVDIHLEKANKMILSHRQQLDKALDSFPKEKSSEFTLKAIQQQEEMVQGAKQVVSSSNNTSHSLGASHTPTPTTSPAEAASKLRNSILKKIHSTSDYNPGRGELEISMQYANSCLDSAKADNLTSAIQFLENIISQEQAVLNSSPSATFTTFLQKYGYEGYNTGAKDSLLLCPQMANHSVEGAYGLPMRFIVDMTVFMNPNPAYSPDGEPNYPPTPEILAMMHNVSNLQQLNSPFANWVIQQIQYNSAVTMSMTGSQIFTYLTTNFNIFDECPGLTIQEVQNVIQALKAPPMSNISLLALKLNQFQYPKGSPLYNLQQALIAQCSKSATISGFEAWIQNDLINAKADIYMQFPEITQTDINTIMSIAGYSGTIPAPTSMDQLFTEAFTSYQADQNSPIYKDLYQELLNLGSASENTGALQQWGATMLNNPDFTKSSAQAQANFCVWTGNITLAAMNTILTEWSQSNDISQAALANFILSKKFTSLEQMRDFFNPNSPSYGFGKYDIYFQIPALLKSSNPQGLVQNFITDLFADTTTKPTISNPTQVDTAYANASAALSGASPADQALYNALINECKAMGSQWDQLPYWAGWQSLSSVFTNASAQAQSLFFNSCGITNAQTAPLIGSEYYLKQMLGNFSSSSQTYQTIQQIITELQSSITNDGSWSSFQSWITGTLFAKDDLYMLCPDASQAELSSIYQYIEGPGATLPTETVADTNFIAVYQAMNAPRVFSGNKALFQDLLNAMLSVGSASQNQAQDIQNYFTANPSVFAQLKKDWAASDSQGQALFEKYTNNWNPAGS